MADSDWSARKYELALPWVFDRHKDRHLVFRRRNADPLALPFINHLLGEILCIFPPGSVRFLLIDPKHLGSSFNNFVAMKDADPDSISEMVWTKRRDIQDQLAKVVEAIALINQSMLRDQYDTIDDYNAAFAQRSGAADQPYRFIAIADFPHEFDQYSCQLLQSIMANGPRCGVHVLMDFDSAAALPHDVDAESFLNDVMVVNPRDHAKPFVQPSWGDAGGWAGAVLDQPASSDMLAAVVARHVEGLAAARRNNANYSIDLMFRDVVRQQRTPLAGLAGQWSGRAGSELVIPLGQAGADRLESLVFGRNGSTTHHAIAVGTTGSGKSNLLHVIIQSVAEFYSPDEVSLFLVDGKFGAEFSPYATGRLPHAELVALNSDPEFARGVLDRLYEEVQRRTDLFVANGVRDYSAYRELPDAKPLPRILALFDEFQFMLAAQDREIFQAVTQLLRDLAKQGRSAGIHLVLATQTLEELELPADMLSQVGGRIILKSPDAAWTKLLSSDNRGPAMLERAGQAIVNLDSGSLAGNRQAQIARALERATLTNWLSGLRQRAEQSPLAAMKDRPLFVFDGNEVAQLSGSVRFQAMLAAWPLPAPRRTRPLPVLVGEPIAMRPSHALGLRRQAEANILVLERDQAVAQSSMLAMLLSALAQRGPGEIDIDLFDFAGHQGLDEPEFEWRDLERALSPRCVRVHGLNDIDPVFDLLGQALGEGALPIARTRLIVLFGLHRARGLWDAGGRFADEAQAALTLLTLLRRGPEAGFHVLAWCDTYQNLERALGTDISEFGMGLVGRVDARVSQRLLEDDVAASARSNRLVAFDRSQSESLQLVRRFALPDDAWRDATLASLAARWATGGS